MKKTKIIYQVDPEEEVIAWLESRLYKAKIDYESATKRVASCLTQITNAEKLLEELKKDK